jgi:hypothetical protein
MPYRHAWLFIVVLIGATVFAFWRSYFAIFSASPAGFHIHGVTASLWMLLLLGQSWTPHHGQIKLHRLLGRATFVAIPLFAAGSMGVIHSMATATAGGDPFYALWGARLAFIDWLAFGALLYAAGMALRHRRNVRLHAGYMLSTALPLISPVFGRVVNRTVPGLMIHGPQDFPVFGWCAQIGNGMAAMIALWLWRRDPRVGRPWAVVLGVVVVQIIGFETVATSDGWRAVSAAVGTLPLAGLMAFGAAAGVGAVVLGWMLPVGRKVGVQRAG